MAWADTCTHCYYLTAGDQGRMTIVNLDTQTWWQTSLYGNEYAIAAFQGYENTVGAYNNPGGQYDSMGNAITPLNNVWNGGQFLDGTTDGTNNYAVDYYSGNVYKTDSQFNNAQMLFGLGGPYTNMGIAYVNGNLWIQDRWGIPGRITEYSMQGVPLFYFDTGVTATGSLAYDMSNNSLWFIGEGCGLGTCLFDYSLNGTLLQSFSIAVSDNILGGEISPVPEPGILLLMGSGAFGVLGVLRRKLL